MYKFLKIPKSLAQIAAASFSPDCFGRKDRVEDGKQLQKILNRMGIHNFLETKIFFRKFALQNKGIELC